MSEREDRQDITDVLLRYATGIDRRDWPLFRTVFADDCELDYGEVGSWKGVDAVTEFMQQAHAMAGHTMHRLTNQVITVDGDKAQSRTYVDALIMVGETDSGVIIAASPGSNRGKSGLTFANSSIVAFAVGTRVCSFNSRT